MLSRSKSNQRLLPSELRAKSVSCSSKPKMFEATNRQSSGKLVQNNRQFSKSFHSGMIGLRTDPTFITQTLPNRTQTSFSGKRFVRSCSCQRVTERPKNVNRRPLREHSRPNQLEVTGIPADKARTESLSIRQLRNLNRLESDLYADHRNTLRLRLAECRRNNDALTEKVREFVQIVELFKKRDKANKSLHLLYV